MKVSNLELKYLSAIADSVDSFLKSKNKTISANHELFPIMARCLAHVTPGMEFHPYLVNMPSDKDSFIVSIYPDMDELDRKSVTLLQYMNEGKTEEFLKEWADIKKWCVEIDSRLLTKGSSLCVDDGNQFVAILCHELGHVMGESPLRLMQNYIYQKKTYDKVGAMIISKNPLVRKFALPMFVHTLQFKLILRKFDSVKDEIRADHYVPNEYREDLISYFENHILQHPDRSKLVVTKEDFDNEQNTSIVFSREVIHMIKRRRDALKTSIKAQYDHGDSKYMKDMVSKIGKVAMGYDPEKNETNTVYESSMLRVFDMNVEECVVEYTSMMESANVTARDISILQVQAEDIKTVDQKLFVVHTIYDYLEILYDQKEKLMKKSGSSEVLTKHGYPQDAQIKILNDILEDVMKKKVSDVGDRYGIFIKYPKGYEG